MKIQTKTKQILILSFKLGGDEEDESQDLEIFYSLLYKIREYYRKPGFKAIRLSKEEIEIVDTLVNIIEGYENNREQEDSEGVE